MVATYNIIIIILHIIIICIFSLVKRQSSETAKAPEEFPILNSADMNNEKRKMKKINNKTKEKRDNSETSIYYYYTRLSYRLGPLGDGE